MTELTIMTINEARKENPGLLFKICKVFQDGSSSIINCSEESGENILILLEYPLHFYRRNAKFATADISV